MQIVVAQMMIIMMLQANPLLKKRLLLLFLHRAACMLSTVLQQFGQVRFFPYGALRLSARGGLGLI